MSTSDIRIEVFDLNKFYREGPIQVHAVRGVNLTVRAGTMVLLVGPSGSGKTTLLSILGCILKPSSGEIRIRGKPVVWKESELPTVRRKNIGFVFQHFNLLSALTAAENVEVALRLKKIRKRRAKKARELLDAVGLSHRYNFLPRDLSGGEKQRVAIARALVGDPPIILADEPTGNLDSDSGRIVVDLLKQAAVKEKRAVLVVSHDLRILDFADEAYRMEDGRLQGYRATGPEVLDLDVGSLSGRAASR
ncbi:MAG: ABC transporter ATP-binding protein [Acidobacteriota bacterium]